MSTWYIGQHKNLMPWAITPSVPIAWKLMKQSPVLSCEDFHLRWQKHMVFQRVSNRPDFPPVGGERLSLQIHGYGKELSVWGSVSWAKENDCKGSTNTTDKQGLPSLWFKLESCIFHINEVTCSNTELALLRGRNMVSFYRQRAYNITTGYQSPLLYHVLDRNWYVPWHTEYICMWFYFLIGRYRLCRRKSVIP